MHRFDAYAPTTIGRYEVIAATATPCALPRGTAVLRREDGRCAVVCYDLRASQVSRAPAPLSGVRVVGGTTRAGVDYVARWTSEAQALTQFSAA